jgi:alpha-D-ribose 1-methylphosphonate 5-triphosphate synthase subunit PhnI
VIERPQNLRTSATAERTHNSRRHNAEPRWDTAEPAGRAYRGSHRAEHLHRADEGLLSAYDRSSRVGRHHAHPAEGHSNRW